MNRLLFPMGLIVLLLMACTEQDELIDNSKPKTVEYEIPATGEGFDVGGNEVQNIIDVVFPSKSRSRGAGDYTISIINGKDGNPGIYVVNFSDDGGFLLVSATKKYMPILAYNDQGNYDLTDMDKPLAVLEWQNMQMEAIKMAEETSDTIDARWDAFSTPTIQIPERIATSRYGMEDLDKLVADSLASWESKGYSVSTIDSYEPRSDEERSYLTMIQNDIAPNIGSNWKDYVFVVRYSRVGSKQIPNMLTTKWHQDHNFNAYFPFFEPGKKQYVGCGPVAAGQIMRYHEKPANINWKSMPDTYANNPCAELLHNLALAADAKYDTKENKTSTTFEGMKKAIESYGYKCKLGDYVHSIVFRNLTAKRPVFVGGWDESEGGHAWVICGATDYETSSNEIVYYPTGYSQMGCAFYHEDNYYHIYTHYCNWGWGGGCDGFYSMDTFNPDKYNFSKKLQMLYDIYY